MARGQVEVFTPRVGADWLSPQKRSTAVKTCKIASTLSQREKVILCLKCLQAQAFLRFLCSAKVCAYLKNIYWTNLTDACQSQTKQISILRLVCEHYIKTATKMRALTSALHVECSFPFGKARKPSWKFSQLLNVLGQSANTYQYAPTLLTPNLILIKAYR